MITYNTISGHGKPLAMVVKLDGKTVGQIQGTEWRGYWFRPKGSKIIGETFATIDEVKRSLEA